jgi:hypothetical protein
MEQHLYRLLGIAARGLEESEKLRDKIPERDGLPDWDKLKKLLKITDHLQALLGELASQIHAGEW